jgi:hypothetical protein
MQTMLTAMLLQIRNVVDPDSVTLWIRIRIGNPDPGSGDKKIKKFQWKRCTFKLFFFKFFFTTIKV